MLGLTALLSEEGITGLPRGAAHAVHLMQGVGGIWTSWKEFSQPLNQVLAFTVSAGKPAAKFILQGVTPAPGFYVLVAGFAVALLGLYMPRTRK